MEPYGHRYVGCDLIVSRATRVQLSGDRTDDLAKSALNRHMDVFVSRIEWKVTVLEFLGNLGQTRIQLLTFGLIEDAEPFKGLDMRPRLAYIVRCEPAIEIDRAIEAPEARIRGLMKAGHAAGDYRVCDGVMRAGVAIVMLKRFSARAVGENKLSIQSLLQRRTDMLNLLLAHAREEGERERAR